jgi:hypothetical protein
MKTKLRFVTLGLALVGALATVVAQPAHAQTAMIETRAQTIAKADVNAIMADYAADPVLHWIGGPLAGEYKGTEAIQGVWTKFTTAQAPLTVKVANPHSMGADTLMADTTFTGGKGNAIPVLYSVKTEGGKIKEETWKVNAPAAAAPASAASPAASPKGY